MNRYSLFLDVAGQITRETTNQSCYTVAAVAFHPGDVENAIALLTNVHRKWSGMDDVTATRLAKFVLSRSVAACVRRIRKAQPCWEGFWNDGAAFHQFIASAEKSRVSFVKPSNVIRYAAFG